MEGCKQRNKKKLNRGGLGTYSSPNRKCVSETRVGYRVGQGFHFYHGSTLLYLSLYLSLLYSITALLHYTGLYYTVPWHYWALLYTLRLFQKQCGGAYRSRYTYFSNLVARTGLPTCSPEYAPFCLVHFLLSPQYLRSF